MKVTTIRHICDRCKKEMAYGYYSRIGRRISFWVFSAMMEREICRECREDFDAWWSFQWKSATAAHRGEGGKGV